MIENLRIARSTVQQAAVLHLSGTVDGDPDHEVSHLVADVTATMPPPSLVILDLRRVELLTADGVRILRSVAGGLDGRGITCRLLIAAGSTAALVLDLADPERELVRFSDLRRCLIIDRAGGEQAHEPAGVAHDRSDQAGDGLARILSDLARSLQDEDSLPDTLGAITAAAVTTVPGVEYAGLMVFGTSRHIESTAMTAELVAAADQAQYDTGEGPCLAAVAGRRVIRVDDMAHETRWPHFSRRAVQLGVRSMLSFQLYVTGDKLGGLNLYARQPHAFDDESEQIGQLFASHAAVAMAGARREDDLNRAITGRDIIGQAKGILMERHRITGDDAFRLLVRVSQHTNVKLTEVARRLTETGEFDQEPRRRG